MPLSRINLTEIFSLIVASIRMWFCSKIKGSANELLSPFVGPFTFGKITEVLIENKIMIPTKNLLVKFFSQKPFYFLNIVIKCL